MFSSKALLFVPEELEIAGPGHHLPPLELKVYKDTELHDASKSDHCISIYKNSINFQIKDKWNFL